MSIFSRIGRSFKRVLRKVLPIAAPILGAVFPGIGGIIGGGLLSAATQRRAPPPDIARPPLPGAGFVQTRQTRFGTLASTRGVAGPSRRVIQLPPVGQTRTQQMSIFAALPAIGRAAPSVLGRLGRVLSGRTATAATGGFLAGQLLSGDGAAGAACPAGFHPAKDGSGRCVKNRRMNFGNAHAARRSVRRLKGARKLLKDIEKMMPKQPSRRAAPVRHITGPAHTT